MTNKLIGLLGLTRRAGKLTTGFDAVAGKVAAGQAGLVLLAADLSEKTEKELRRATADKTPEIRRLPLDKETIAAALGLYKPVGVLAVGDSGLAAAIRRSCRDDLEEELPYDD